MTGNTEIPNYQSDDRGRGVVVGRFMPKPEPKNDEDSKDSQSEPAVDPLNVSQMTREQRDGLKRRILSQHPELVDELTS